MSPRPSLKEIRKPQVLRATIDALYERGVSAVRISDIAEGVGIHPSTVLHYVPSRDQLIEEALDFTEENYYTVLQEQVAQQTTPAARLRWLFHRFSHSPDKLDDWTMFIEIWALARRRPEMRELQRRIQGRLRAIIAEVIEQGIVLGEFDVVDVAETTLGLTSMLDGLGVLRTLEDPEVTAERMEALMLTTASRLLGCELSAVRVNQPVRTG